MAAPPPNALLRNRDFALLWSGALISMTGNWMLMVALPMHVYESTGSTAATSLMFVAGVMPRIALGSVAGVFVDRWDRKRTMVLTNALLMLSLVPIAVAAVTGGVWLIYLGALLQSTVAQFFGPAETALLPSLVHREQLPAANALNALNNNLARFVGPALGGIIVAHAGLLGVVLVDAASYGLAAALIVLVRAPARLVPAKVPARGGAIARVASEWRAGLEVVRRRRVVALLVAVTAVASLGEGAFGVLLAPFVSEAFAGGTLELGSLMSAQAIGGMAGGAVVAWLASRVAPARLLGLGALAIGLVDLVIINYHVVAPVIWPAIILMVLVGLPAAAYGAAFLTLLQTNVEDELLGRVTGIVSTVSALAMLLGMAGAGLLGDAVGVVRTINVQAIAYVAAGVFVLASLGRLGPRGRVRPVGTAARRPVTPQPPNRPPQHYPGP